MRLPHFWLSSLFECAGWVLGICTSFGLWTWIVFAAGEAHMATLQITAIGEADYCHATLRQLIPRAEEAARVTEVSRDALEKWLAYEPRPEVVVVLP